MPIESAAEYSAGSTVMKSYISKPEKAEYAYRGIWFSEWWGSQIILNSEPNNWLSWVWQWLLICMGKVKSPLISRSWFVDEWSPQQNGG